MFRVAIEGDAVSIVIMVFYFYEDAMKDVAKISVDGLVPNSFHLSHWKGNQTPVPLKADTATEIAFRYISHPDRKSFFPQASIITNNHFDTDGLLSVWTLLNPRKAEPMAGRLISAAEAGDFSIFSSEEGVQINLLIHGLCQARKGPISDIIDAYSGPREAAYYKGLLPLIPDLFRKKDDYRSFWGPPFEAILHSMDLFEKGVVGVDEYEEEALSVIMDESRPARQAIDHYCQGDLILVVEDREKNEGGFGYELEYRYYSWADTVTRPPIKTIDMVPLAKTLNRLDSAASGHWVFEDYPGRAMTSALKYTDARGGRRLSHLHPEEVIRSVLVHLQSQKDTNG
ncbi:MAG: DUF6687 family protein [Nitrospiria bacterium]